MPARVSRTTLGTTAAAPPMQCQFGFSREGTLTSGNVRSRPLALPVWAAVLLGVGATSGAWLRCEDGRILLSEAGGPFHEIKLGDNEDAKRLRILLAQAGAIDAQVHVTVQPTAVADGGQSVTGPKEDKSAPKDDNSAGRQKSG